ncbi:DUF2169 family type VI secretion system accessory protein [Paraburkholderia phosphatilytica]|uniref:DUF2169 family type VI secretion system accessory protein n=1 Tax=Paraburkholderia phosphatilytica TaxID=2282883 RepID=UPI000E557146|nr:DUF2169 domain-containing protein [Paraburkholderia phosphatilytica]
MEFRNLTPLHAMAFHAIDLHDHEFHVVVLKAGYRLEPIHIDAPDADTHACRLLAGNDAVRLAMADEYEGETGSSSVKWESDLAPFKPKCDFLVRATAHAPEGKPLPSWPVRVRISLGDKVVIDKGLRVTGPRVFQKGWRGWRLAVPEAVATVPMRWEYAFGGCSRVVAAAGVVGLPAERELNEVCFSNPLGRGWVEKRFPGCATAGDVVASSSATSALTHVAKIAEIPAPQIEEWDSPIESPVFAKHPLAPIDAARMAEVAASYGVAPVGLGVVGRAWAPRLMAAGTYDEAWRADRWPHLPLDFDFGYWNGAPADQQIAWPDNGISFELANLAAPAHTCVGFLRARLPEHRALVALRFESGAIAPVPMRADTVFIDAEEMLVLVTWRAVFPVQPTVRVCEARFETNPTAPLLQINTDARQTETEEAWLTT